MKKIVFAITSLNQGGAERVLVDIINRISTKYDITIFTFYGDNDFDNQLPKDIKRIYYTSLKRSQMSPFSKFVLSLRLMIPHARRYVYKKFIQGKFDEEVAFLEGPVTWLLATPDKVNKPRKIAWIHNDIEKVFGEGKKSNIKQFVNQSAYKKYDELVFVSNDNYDRFTGSPKFKKNKVHKRVIYNYLDIREIRRKAYLCKPADMKNDLPSFVQVSRLVEQKAIDRLIGVHKRLIDDGYMHRMYIVGDGPLREKLQKQIDDLGVGDTFILLGGRDNPYPYIKNGNYFMLMSEFEGFGMTVIEAEALNKFIIVTDTAAREAIIGYSDAKLVYNNADAMYEGLKEILIEKPIVMEDNQFTNDNVLREIYDLLEGK